MAKRMPMTPTQRELARRRKLIERWRAQQRAVRLKAEIQCQVLQRRIDRETILSEAIERGALKV